jgi:hypothetical protein
MAKKRRARAKKKSNPKKRRTHRRRKTAASPVKRRRRTSHRRKNPARRTRRTHARKRRSNPGAFKSRRRSTHRRRNPGSGGGGNLTLKNALIGLAAAGLAFLGVQAATYYATKDMSKDGERNRKLLAGAAVVAGLYLALKKRKPVIGLALAAGGLLSGFGSYLILNMMRFMPVKQSAQISGFSYEGMNGYAYEGAPQLGAVAYDNMRAVAYDNMQAVAYDNMQGIGSPVPPPPWASASPF